VWLCQERRHVAERRRVQPRRGLGNVERFEPGQLCSGKVSPGSEGREVLGVALGGFGRLAQAGSLVWVRDAEER
jgi:hypothetical protein